VLGFAAAAAGWPVPVLAVSARRSDGLAELIAALDGHARWLAEAGRGAAARHAQAEHWLVDAVRERFGRDGVARAGPLQLDAGESPFERLAAVAAALRGEPAGDT
jgi:LAO/AO transport system kinase